MQPLLTADDIASTLRVSVRRARDLVRMMPHYSVGTGAVKPRLVVSQEDFDRWLASRRQVPAPPPPPMPRQRKPKPILYDPNLFEPDGRVKRRR